MATDHHKMNKLSLLHELAKLAVRATPLNETLDRSLAEIVQFTQAIGGLIVLLNPAGDGPIVRSTDTCPTGPGILAGWHLDTDQHYPHGECRVGSAASAGLPAGLVALCQEQGVESIQCAPLSGQDAALGLVCVFDGREENSVLTLAGYHLAGAVERALLREEIQQKESIRSRLLSNVVSAQERERERISRELHDETGQALTALLVQLRVLEESPAANAFTDQVQILRDIVSQTLEEIRRLARDLRPATLDDLGLLPTLKSYVKEYARNSGLNVQFDVNDLGWTRLPFQTEVVLYRVAQEALTNVVRHAHANSVLVQLARNDDSISLRVKDNGSGFELGRSIEEEDRCLGLSGMKERVELIGGKFQITARPGYGTDVHVHVPVGEDG